MHVLQWLPPVGMKYHIALVFASPQLFIVVLLTRLQVSMRKRISFRLRSTSNLMLRTF